MNLDELQVRLETHFSELAEGRLAHGLSGHVFALEHGLNDDERAELKQGVQRQAMSLGRPLSKHWLAWVVYAAEFGYAYSGEEYWQTFEEDTPGWPDRSRGWIRDQFRRFSRTYSGVVPSGAWANQFTIIAWPIRHAILPTDLQRQLARVLYEARFTISEAHLLDPELLGSLIQSRAWDASSRFQQLAQETELVGQIATALLLHSPNSEDALLQSSTLDRITGDLTREGSAKAWLRGAQRAAIQTLERRPIRGTPVAPRRSTEPPTNPGDARSELQALALEPTMHLQPSEDGWLVRLLVPDLAPLMSRYPSFESALKDSRCRVTGALDSRPLARGRVLSSARDVVLGRWPQSASTLLQFEHSTPQLDFLLRADCLMRPGPTWLFGVSADGIGRELRGRRVRPGGRYLLVAEKGLLTVGQEFAAANLHCEGVECWELDVPEIIPAGYWEALKPFALAPAAGISVGPWSRPARWCRRSAILLRSAGCR